MRTHRNDSIQSLVVGAVDSKLILIFGETDGSLNEAGPNQAVMMRLVGGPRTTGAQKFAAAWTVQYSPDRRATF
jgi:signal recognition particle GTPase